jgi:hypothetical protein
MIFQSWLMIPQKMMDYHGLMMVNDGIDNGINHGISDWWFGTCFFPFSWECHHPN